MKHKIASHRKFIERLIKGIVVGLVFLVIALLIGMCGYHYLEDMSWIDAFSNASMILSGMGPFGPLKTFQGKLFAGFYALFSGLFFILIIGVILAPVFHRIIHKLNIEDDAADTDK